MHSPPTDKDGILVIEKCFRILEIIASAPDHAVHISEISKVSGMSQATVSRIIGTLFKLGYLDSAGRKQGYSLGGKLFDITAHHHGNNELRRLVLPLLADFHKETGLYVSFSILLGQSRYTLCHFYPGGDKLDREIWPSLENLYRSVTGRMLLAWQSRSFQQNYLSRHGLSEGQWPGINDTKTFFSKLDEIRTLNTISEAFSGKVHLGVTVKYNDFLIGAIGCILPDFDSLPVISAKLARIAEKISEKY